MYIYIYTHTHTHWGAFVLKDAIYSCRIVSLLSLLWSKVSNFIRAVATSTLCSRQPQSFRPQPRGILMQRDVQLCCWAYAVVNSSHGLSIPHLSVCLCFCLCLSLSLPLSWLSLCTHCYAYAHSKHVCMVRWRSYSGCCHATSACCQILLDLL